MVLVAAGINNDDADEKNIVERKLIAEPNGSQSLVPRISPFSVRVASERYTGATTAGPFIFVVGGRDNRAEASWKGTNNAFLLHSEAGNRIDLPPMAIGRVRPVVAVFGQQLYVFGGTDKFEHWCEIFDMKLWRWRSVPAPVHLPTFSDSMFSAVDYDKELVLFGDWESLTTNVYCFDVRTECWAYFDQFDWDNNLRGQAVVVKGGVGAMYYWSDDKLWFYDPYTRYLFETEVEGLKEKGYVSTRYFTFRPSLLHLGFDHFCLVWMDVHGRHRSNGSDYASVHCTGIKATFSTVENGGDPTTRMYSFKAFAEYSKSYLIDPVSLEFGHAFLL